MMGRACARLIIALRSAGRPCRAHRTKIVGQRQLADLGMKRLHVEGWRGRLGLRTKHPGSPFQELSLPGRDLVWMYIELLGEFGQRLLASHGSQGHLCLEGRRMVPARSFAHRLSCSAAILAAVRQKLHSAPLSKSPEPPLRRAEP